jgi:hypothetical protein
VSRLGEFSSNGWLFTLDSAWKLQKYPAFLGYFVPWLSLITDLEKKCVGLHFGPFISKLIWSSWLAATCWVGSSTDDDD